jgi:hypothetical protein
MYFLGALESYSNNDSKPPLPDSVGIHSEKRKGRKSKFLFTAQLLGKWNLFRDFQQVQIYSIAHKKQKRLTAGTQSMKLCHGR